MKELEARIWCPKCKVVKYDVYRLHDDDLHGEGVYEHVTDPKDLSNFAAKYCECGATLERKP